MKKNWEKLVSGAIIMAVTLTAGFLITLISFRLFDTLTANQMKILFAADIVALSLAAVSVWYTYEAKRIKLKREQEFKRRHLRRIEKHETELAQIKKWIDPSDFAA